MKKLYDDFYPLIMIFTVFITIALVAIFMADKFPSENLPTFPA